MADGVCDFADDGHDRNWILTRLNPIATVELCDDDFAPGVIPILAGYLGVDPMSLYEAIKRYVDKEAKAAAKHLAEAEAAAKQDGTPEGEPAAATNPGDADGGPHGITGVPSAVGQLPVEES